MIQMSILKFQLTSLMHAIIRSSNSDRLLDIS